MNTEITDKITKMLYGETIGESQKQLICINCKKPICITEKPTNMEGNIYSRNGLKEYQISGLCEYCFDKTYMELEDEIE